MYQATKLFPYSGYDLLPMGIRQDYVWNMESYLKEDGILRTLMVGNSILTTHLCSILSVFSPVMATNAPETGTLIRSVIDARRRTPCMLPIEEDKKSDLSDSDP